MQAPACIAPLYGLITVSRKPPPLPHTLGSALGCMGGPCIRWLFSYRLHGKPAHPKCRTTLHITPAFARAPAVRVCSQSHSVPSSAPLPEPQHPITVCAVIPTTSRSGMDGGVMDPMTLQLSRLLIIQGCVGFPIEPYITKSHRQLLSKQRRVSAPRHVFVKYTTECRALVVLIEAHVEGLSSCGPCKTPTSGARVVRLVLPLELMEAMTPIDEPANEVDLAMLLHKFCNFQFVDFCMHEVTRARDAATHDNDVAMSRACLELRRAVRTMRMLPIYPAITADPRTWHVPAPTYSQWPTFVEWCMQDNWVGVRTPWHHGAVHILKNARDALKRELMAALLAADTHLACSGYWRVPCIACGCALGPFSEVEMTGLRPPGPQGMGVVWIVRQDTFVAVQNRGATATELFGLGRMCSVQRVGIDGDLVVEPVLNGLKVRPHMSYLDVCTCPYVHCQMLAISRPLVTPQWTSRRRTHARSRSSCCSWTCSSTNACTKLYDRWLLTVI